MDRRGTGDGRRLVHLCIEHDASGAARRAGPSAAADIIIIIIKDIYIAQVRKGHKCASRRCTGVCVCSWI